MAADPKTKIFYISLGFWLIIGVVSYYAWSNHRLTVQTGGSVTIPCHYDKKCTQQKKYWFSEIDKTYRNTSEENLSIIDHPEMNLFTVSMRNLENEDTGLYSCVVDIEGNLASTCVVYLKVQSGKRFCIYFNHILMLNMCFIISNDWGMCVFSSWCVCGEQQFQISDDDDGGRSFTVLMTGLRLTDSGWYFCSAGQAVSPVHLTVTEAEPDREIHVSIQTFLIDISQNHLRGMDLYLSAFCYHALFPQFLVPFTLTIISSLPT
uniref:Polymeric immunoglobulin receptor-like 2.3 n=1 Tax=Sinocyclocheilus anshuiensis TaxID=1608454 RepID=A0A671SPF9_9TELE